jgi:histidine triad (HIT) family protein
MHEKTDITSRRYIAQEELTFLDTPRMPNHELSATAENIVAALRTIG